MKVCIVCYGLNEHNIRLQPWRYIFEIASGISKRNVNVTIITDGTSNKHDINGIPVLYTERLRKLPFESNLELISLLKSEGPDIILWSVSALDYLYFNTFKKVNTPIIAVFTGPIYKISDIIRIGISEILKNINFLSLHIIYASLPSFFIRGIVNSPYCNTVFVMSRKNKEAIMEMGGNENKVVHIPVGIDESDFSVSNMYNSIVNKYNLNINSYNVLYFGSPLTIRGIDSVIRAISKVKDSYPYVKLLILSRRRDYELIREELGVRSLVLKEGAEKNIQIIFGFLDKEEVKKFIYFSDLIVLPFKIAPSDVPTSILESMAMGKPVISTEVDGIPELLEDGRGFVVKPNNDKDLVEKIMFSIQNRDLVRSIGSKAAAYMQTYPKWSDISEFVISEINEVVNGKSISEVTL